MTGRASNMGFTIDLLTMEFLVIDESSITRALFTRLEAEGV